MTVAGSPDPLEAIPWGEVFERLTHFAKRRLGARGTIRDAEDLAMDAISQFLDPEYEWDRSRPVEQVLGSIVNGLIQNRSRRHYLKSERSSEKRVAHAEDPRPSAAERAETADCARKKIDLLLERVARDTTVEAIVMLELEGIDEPKEQARRLKVASQDLYKARRRLQGHIDAVNEEWHEQED